MRGGGLLLATLREAPADAEISSHRLMLRAGIIRKLSSGLYNWLPLGVRILRKIETVIREEMDASGAQEVLMPVVHPAELWQESNRWETSGPELIRFQNRQGQDFCLAPTHEEVITDIARREFSSYRQLPVNLYQIQLKYRDELRPRFGVMRAREFIMMDGYSFHIDSESLSETYRAMYDCYERILKRLGLEYRVVEADSGNIGGNLSHEFQVLASSGEDVLAVSDKSDYAANLEQAECVVQDELRPAPSMDLSKISTPDVATIADICSLLDLPPEQTLKMLIVRGQNSPLVGVALRGDHELNLAKAGKHPEIAAPVQFAEPEEIKKHLGISPGSIGPCGLSIPVLADHSAALVPDFVCGANEDGYHFVGANWDRDAQAVAVADFRNVTEGEPCPDGKGHIQFIRGIEAGHIFQLGTKYSEALSMKVQNQEGKEVAPEMGCYGIGVSRLVAALIEQNHDEKGIIWSSATAPFQVILVALNYHKSEKVRTASEALYQQFIAAGLEVLIDDRDERPGVKLADSELVGFPYSVVVGERGLKNDKVELRMRRDSSSTEVNFSEVTSELQSRLAT